MGTGSLGVGTKETIVKAEEGEKKARETEKDGELEKGSGGGMTQGCV